MGFVEVRRCLDSHGTFTRARIDPDKVVSFYQACSSCYEISEIEFMNNSKMRVLHSLPELEDILLGNRKVY